MIKEKKLIVYTTAANAVSKGYWNVLVPSIKSVTKHDFVDRFVVLHGESKDGTVDRLQGLKTENEKLEPVSSPVWNPNAWTWNILLEQYNHFLRMIMNESSSTGQEVIVLYQGSDQVWTDVYANELHSVLEQMIEVGHDYVLTPFRKTVNINRLTPIYPYHSTGFTVYSAMRIRPGFSYEILGNEDILKTNSPVKRMYHNFRNSSISYDMAFFTREQILNKIINHGCGISQREVDDYIRNGFLKKCLSMNLTKVDIADHPIEMHDMLNSMDESLFGKTCFGHLGVS